MARHASVPARALPLLAVLLTSATIIAPAMAAGSDIIDGVPSATACAALGFDASMGESPSGNGPAGGLRRQFAPGTGIITALPRTMEQAAAPPMPSAQALGKSYADAVGVDTERYPHATSNPIKRVAEDPVSTFSIDVDTASYANVRRFLNDGTLPPRDAVRVEEMINYFDYGYAKPPSADTPFAIHATVTPSPWQAGHEIVHIGLQGYDIARDHQPPLNLVFLVDVSGSMQGPDRLELAQKALNVLIDQLRPEDRVSLAVYAGAAGAVLPPTPGTQKLKLRCAVDALRAGGSTAGGQGLALAYGMAEQAFAKDAVNRVILMTDGDFNVGIADPERLKDFVSEKRATGIYLSVYGFGRGNYNDVMMQDLSQSGNGIAAYVNSLNEARRLFRDDLAGSFFPIADDVKIQVEFNPATVAEYRLIGYETRLLNREDFNNDKVDAGEVGAGAAVTAIYEITPVGGPLASDPLRYQDAVTPIAATSSELAYVKVRYKRPGEQTSQLIQRAIGETDRPPTLSAAPEATRWALAVAAFGQRLRGDPWMEQGFGWPQILDLAQGARGDDLFGARAEFVQLVRAAQSLVTE